MRISIAKEKQNTNAATIADETAQSTAIMIRMAMTTVSMGAKANPLATNIALLIAIASALATLVVVSIPESMLIPTSHP